jgi:hypothetical protein
MAMVTEKWSARRFQRGKSDVRAWDVTDCANISEACAAVPAQADSTDPWDSRLIAGEPEGSHTGPVSWLVTVNYAMASEGSGGGATPEVGAAPEFWWEREIVTEPAEYDDDGNPLITSSFEPIAGLSDDILIPVLVFERMEAGFSPSIMTTYNGAFNSATMTVLGESYARGKIMMEINPIGRGKMSNPSLPIAVQYRFKFLPSGPSSWEFWRVPDMGTRARYGPQTERFSSLYEYNSTSPAESKVVTSPVRLKGAGAPYDAGLKVKDATGAFIDPYPGPTLPGVTYEDTQYATFLKYKRKRKPIDFVALGLFA